MKGVTGVAAADPPRSGSQKRADVDRILNGTPEDYLSDGRRRCKSASKARGGARCGNPAIPGGLVCRIHGGGSPQVKRKAALRLLELVDPAIATVARIMSDPDAPHAARLRAAENVLDRAGVPRSVDVTDSEAAKALLIERLIALRAERESPAAQDIITGEVIRDLMPDDDTDTEEQQ